MCFVWRIWFYLAYLVLFGVFGILFGVFGILVGVFGWLTWFDSFLFAYLVSVCRTWYNGWRIGYLCHCELVHLIVSLLMCRFRFLTPSLKTSILGQEIKISKSEYCRCGMLRCLLYYQGLVSEQENIVADLPPLSTRTPTSTLH